MPLSGFVEALCDGNMDAIYRKSPPKVRLESFERECFNALNEQYMVRILDGDTSVYESLKRMALHLSRIRMLEAVLALLGTQRLDDDTKKISASIGVRLTGDVRKDVLVIVSARELAIRKYNHAKTLYERETSGETKIDRAFFLSMLVSLGAHFKYGIPYMSVTVGEFCSHVLQMKKDINMMKMANAKKSGNGRKY